MNTGSPLMDAQSDFMASVMASPGEDATRLPAPSTPQKDGEERFVLPLVLSPTCRNPAVMREDGRAMAVDSPVRTKLQPYLPRLTLDWLAAEPECLHRGLDGSM